MLVLSILTGKSIDVVKGLHLSRDVLDARVVDATLPLLATFDAFKEALPSKRQMDSVDLLALPGFFSSISVEHLLRHQVVALLACVLLSISAERRQGWCRLVGYNLEADMLEVACRLWDVNTLKDSCEWDMSGGYEDRENVAEAGSRDAVLFMHCDNKCFKLCLCLQAWFSSYDKVWFLAVVAGSARRAMGHEDLCGG